MTRTILKKTWNLVESEKHLVQSIGIRKKDKEEGFGEYKFVLINTDMSQKVEPSQKITG